MNEKIKYLIAVAGLIFIPLLWEFQQPGIKLIGMGVVTLLGFVWLIYRAHKKDDFRIPKFLIFIIVFIIWQLVRFSNTPTNINGTYSIIFRLYILFFVVLFVAQIDNQEKRRFWGNVLIGTGVFYAILDLAYVFNWYSNWSNINGSLFPLPASLLRSPGILFGHPNLQSSYLSLVSPFALVKLLSSNRRSARFLWVVILLILLIANFFTFSRGGWLALAGAFLVTLIFFFRQYWSPRIFYRIQSLVGKYSWVMYIGILILVGLIVGAGFLATQFMRSTPHGTVSGRLDIYNYALRAIYDSPLLGHGTGTVPGLYALRGYAIGGDEVYHSHNFWLEIALESGILGLILILAALGATLWAFRSAWIKWRGDSIARSVLAASAGAGTAFLIHSLFDWQLWEASYVLALAIVIALIFSLTTRKHIFKIRKPYFVISLALLLVTSFIILMLVNRSHPLYWGGKIEASRGDWVSAKEKICRAADLRSSNTFYSFQCSLANAHVAKLNQDQDSLIQAYQYQQRAIDLDPNWYIHWANLASYEWQLGDFESAINHMQKALDLAPNRALFQVNLSWMHEKLGDADKAYRYLENLYCTNPGYENVIIFKESLTLQQVKKQSCPETIDQQAFINHIWAGNRAQERNDLSAAIEHFTQAADANPRSGAPYAYLALAYHKNGNIQESDIALQTAYFVDNNSALNHEIAAKISLVDGNISEAFDHLYKAFLIRRTNPFSRVYYAYEYFDAGLQTDLSPFLARAISAERHELYIQLADYLANQGETEKHDLVTQWLELIKTQ